MVMGVAAVSDPKAFEETKVRIVSLARHAVVGMPALICPLDLFLPYLLLPPSLQESSSNPPTMSCGSRKDF